MPHKITALSTVGKRRQRFLVELDGEPWGELDAEIVVKFGLCKGLPIDSEFAEQLRGEDAFIVGRNLLGRYLARHLCSEAEAVRYLQKKGIGEPVASELSAHFREKGQLDDDAFARRVIRHHKKLKPVGPLKVEQMLRQRGVKEETYGAPLTESFGRSEQQRLARELAERRRSLWEKAEPKKRKQKLVNLLLRNGFESEIVFELARELLDERE